MAEQRGQLLCERGALLYERGAVAAHEQRAELPAELAVKRLIGHDGRDDIARERHVRGLERAPEHSAADRLADAESRHDHVADIPSRRSPGQEMKAPRI